MRPNPTERPIALALSVGGLGVALIGLALTVRPVRASGIIFWLLIGIGGVALVVACLQLLRRGDSRHRLLADECRQVHRAIANLLDEHERGKPGRFGSSHANWSAQTLGRYEQDLRAWATPVFEQAVVAEVVSPAFRPLLGGGSVLQLRALRDRFRDAAEALERSEVSS